MTGANGHGQMVQLSIRGANGDTRELAALTPPEHTITLIDENVEAIDWERCARADIVGVTGMSVQRFRMREILIELKERGCFTVVGGPLDRQAFQDPPDAISGVIPAVLVAPPPVRFGAGLPVQLVERIRRHGSAECLQHPHQRLLPAHDALRHGRADEKRVPVVERDRAQQR